MRQVHIVCGGVLGEGRFEIFIVQFDHNRQKTLLFGRATPMGICPPKYKNGGALIQAFTAVMAQNTKGLSLTKIFRQEQNHHIAELQRE